MHEVERVYNICKSKNESYQSLQRALYYINGYQSLSSITETFLSIAHDY